LGTALKLEPCPFCASDDLVLCARGVVTLDGSGSVLESGPATGDVWVSCQCCDAEGPLAGTRPEAVELWNERLPSTTPRGN
jgi:restriction alleviation protein Lar